MISSWGVVAVIALITEAMVFTPREMSHPKQVFFALILVFMFILILGFSFGEFFKTRFKPIFMFFTKNRKIRSMSRSQSKSASIAVAAPQAATPQEEKVERKVLWESNPWDGKSKIQLEKVHSK